MTSLARTAATVACLASLGGCTGTTPAQRQASDDHTTAASGFGLGPQNFNTNGGAFGPEQSSH